MTIEEGLCAYLVAKPSVSAIVADRIEVGFAPLGEVMPALTVVKISSPRTRAMDGSTGLVRARIQFGCWGNKYSDAKRLFEALRLALDGFAGVMGGVGGVKAQRCFLEDESDQPEPSADDDLLSGQGVRADFTIWYEETPATF